MNGSGHAPLGTTALIYVVVIALFVWRTMRPMRVSAARIWSRPALLVLVTAVSIWAEQMTAPSPAWLVTAIVAGGTLLGIPLGVVRGRHSEVRSTERPGVYYVHSSPIVVVVWLLAFVARAAVRYAMPAAGNATTVWSLGLLAFATSAIAVSAYMIHQKLITVQQAPVMQVSKGGGT